MPRIRAWAAVACCSAILIGCAPAAVAPNPTGIVPSQPITTSADTAPPPGTASPTATDVTGSPAPLRVQFTGDLPAGWQITSEGPLLSFASPGDPKLAIELQANRSVMAEHCELGPEPGVVTTAEAIVGALVARRGIVASGLGPVAVGGLTGQQVDLRVDPAIGTTCPGEDVGFVPLIGSMESYGWGFNGIVEKERIRLLALDAPGDRNFIVLVTAPTGATFDRFIDEASTIIAALRFAIPS